jgi:hypothetical protein
MRDLMRRENGADSGHTVRGLAMTTARLVVVLGILALAVIAASLVIGFAR